MTFTRHSYQMCLCAISCHRFYPPSFISSRCTRKHCVPDALRRSCEWRPLHVRYADFGAALRDIRREEGTAMLFRGALPTFSGFFIYGGIVYPGYEILKRFLFQWVGPAAAIEWRVPLVLASGAFARLSTVNTRSTQHLTRASTAYIHVQLSSSILPSYNSAKPQILPGPLPPCRCDCDHACQLHANALRGGAHPLGRNPVVLCRTAERAAPLHGRWRWSWRAVCWFASADGVFSLPACQNDAHNDANTIRPSSRWTRRLLNHQGVVVPPPATESPGPTAPITESLTPHLYGCRCARSPLV